MKQLSSLVLALLVSFFLQGCSYMEVRTPPVASPDQKYQVLVETRSKQGQSYTRYGKKYVAVAIMDTSAPPEQAKVFALWVILQAGELSWKSSWLDPASVRIDFFEPRVGVKSETSRGFLLIRKDNKGAFHVVDHSREMEIKDRSYFLLTLQPPSLSSHPA